MTTRIYDVDSEGRRFLLHRPGDVITAAEAKRVAALVESQPDAPDWTALLVRPHAPADETPIKPLDRMNLAELRAVCADEEIDPGDATLRADYRKKIEAGREKRRSTPKER